MNREGGVAEMIRRTREKWGLNGGLGDLWCGERGGSRLSSRADLHLQRTVRRRINSSPTVREADIVHFVRRRPTKLAEMRAEFSSERRR